jgi:hypothetical protein
MPWMQYVRLKGTEFRPERAFSIMADILELSITDAVCAINLSRGQNGPRAKGNVLQRDGNVNGELRY